MKFTTVSGPCRGILLAPDVAPHNATLQNDGFGSLADRGQKSGARSAGPCDLMSTGSFASAGCASIISGLRPDSRHEDGRWIASVWAKSRRRQRLRERSALARSRYTIKHRLQSYQRSLSTLIAPPEIPTLTGRMPRRAISSRSRNRRRWRGQRWASSGNIR